MVYQVKQLSESLTGRVEVTHLSENSFGSLIPARGYFHLKTVIDFFVALALLPILTVPMMLHRDSRSASTARGRRCSASAASASPARRSRSTSSAPCGSMTRARTSARAAMTGDGDDRITRLGAFLRRTRIDELPQIFNILKGEMSWIGPRPEALVLSNWYTGEMPFYRYRHVVRPGISGWAQVNQGHVAEVDEVHGKLQYDFFYIKYFSPWLDLLILFRTVKTMLTGFGSR